MFYNFYLRIGLDGIILFGFLSYILSILFRPKPRFKSWIYILSGTLTYAFVYNIPRILNQTGIYPQSRNVPPYWYHFLCAIVLSFLFSVFMLEGTFLPKLLYILFFESFVQEYKIVCSPLYDLRTSMEASLYEILDLGTFVFLCIMLFLLSILFRKLRVTGDLKHLPNKIYLIFYFPVSFLAVCMVASNVHEITQYFGPILCAIIMTNIPVIYYFFASIIQAYEEQKRLDRALHYTRSELDKYRLSAEIQENIRKERHELRNRYFYIQTLLKEQQYQKLEDYLDREIGSQMQSLSEISSGNLLMDYILTSKIQEAHKLDIKTYVEVLVPENLPISDDNLCTILLNLLDNAIEASSQEENPDIQIIIKCNGNYLICRILNKVSSDILKENPSLATTKEDKDFHGQGLNIVKDTVKKNNGIFRYAIEGDYFCVTVMMPLA